MKQPSHDAVPSRHRATTHLKIEQQTPCAFATLVLCILLLISGQAWAASAVCNVRMDIDSFLENPAHSEPLTKAVNNIKEGTYQLVPEFREKISTLLDDFSIYIPDPYEREVYRKKVSPRDISEAYTDAIQAILDSPYNSTYTTNGQNAIRTINQVGRLFSAMPPEVLDRMIENKIWRMTSYSSASEAFSRNALRVQLLSSRNLDTLASTDTVAFAGAVRWNGPNVPVTFSGYYTNHPGVAGTAWLPRDASYWTSNLPRYTITDADAYTERLSSHFYSNGSVQINPETGLPAGTTMTDPLSTTMSTRIRNNVGGHTYNNQNTGLPGTHAEVQAANSLADGLSPDNVESPENHIISVHTVRTTRNPTCTGFECCAGCTDILRGWARSTGGGGTLRDPFRR